MAARDQMARLEGFEPPAYRFEVPCLQGINNLHRTVQNEITRDMASIHAGVSLVASLFVSLARVKYWSRNRSQSSRPARA